MDVFVARQPIFDRRLELFAYELLFRSGPENYFTGDADTASPTVIANATQLMELEALTGKHRGFVNFTRTSLLNELALLLPPSGVVVEILETVEPDEEVIAALRRLKEAGYLVALDDYLVTAEDSPLVAFADIVKVDVLATPPSEWAVVARRLAKRGIRMLAEKVETREVMKQASAAGYEYFQGYFFSRPEIVSAKDVPAFRLNYLRLLEALHQPNIGLADLERIIERELSICYRLLRHVNSAAFGLRGRVDSIRQALLLVGMVEIRRWASAWALAGIGRDKPEELIVESVLRARFCELLGDAAGLSGHRGPELFLAGMFSLIDAILDRPLPVLVTTVALPRDSVRALVGEPGPLTPVLECVRAYGAADWQSASVLARKLGLAESALAESYRQAAAWARETYRTPAGEGAVRNS